MRFKALFILATLTLPFAVHAQAPVLVTATITAASNLAPYISGTYQARLVDANGNLIPSGGLPTSYGGSLDSSGALSVSMYPNSAYVSGSQWKFTVCSQTPNLTLPITVQAQKCFSQAVTITGAGDISATLSASAPSIYYFNPVTGALYCANGTGSCASGGTPAFAVDITSAPYNAVCDASADDTAAINLCLKNNAACLIPWNKSATQCNHSGTIHLCPSGGGDYNALYGNGGILAYTGSGTSIDFGSGSGNCTESLIQDVNQDLSGATGTPVSIDIGGCYQCHIVNDEDYSGPSGYFSLSTLSSAPAYSSIENYEGSGILSVTVGNATSTGPLSVTGSWFDSIQIGGTVQPQLSLVSSGAVHGVTVVDSANLTLSAFRMKTASASLTLPASPSNTVINGTLSLGSGGTVTGVANAGKIIATDPVTAASTTYDYTTKQLGTGPFCNDPATGAMTLGNNTGVGAPCP